MRLGIATAITIITSGKVVHCRTTQTGFKAFLRLDGPDVPSMLEIFRDLIPKGAVKWWAKRVSTVSAFECYICSSKPFMSVDLWLPSSKSDGSGLLFKLYSFEVLDMTFAQNMWVESFLCTAIPHNCKQPREILALNVYTLWSRDLVGPQMYVTFFFFLHQTQWVIHTCQNLRGLEQSAFKYTHHLNSHLHKCALLKAWRSSHESLWHNDGEKLSFTLIRMCTDKRFFKTTQLNEYTVCPLQSCQGQ